jgi:integrase/recombinase XerD
VYTIDEAASEKEAVAWLKKKHRELEANAEKRPLRSRAERLTVTQLVDRFLTEGLTAKKKGGERREITQEKYKSSIGNLRDFYAEHGDPAADRLENIDAYLKARTPDITVSSLSQERVVACAMFDWAMREKLLDKNPARASDAPRVQKRRPVILTDPELERLLEECQEPMLRLYTLVQAEAGLRCESEVLWLRWQDLDRVPGFLEVACFDYEEDGVTKKHVTKGGLPRDVPITTRLQAALDAHVAQFKNDGTDSPWVFHDVFGKRINRLDDAFRRARNKARKARRPGDVAITAEFKRTHDLRARRITTWLDENQNAFHIMGWVGHEDLATTMRYARYTRKALQPPRLAPAGVANGG